MEKIKQALDRARQERKAEVASRHNAPAAQVDLSKITYTKTQSVESSSILKRENRILSALEQDYFTDAFKILSTQVLQRMVDHHWSTLAITSPSGGEGKTTTAINLGISIAKEVEYTVLLVDSNLRNPGVHKHFGIKPKYGLRDYLLDNVELSNILFNPKEIEHFVVLPGGEPLTNSSEMLGSPKMCRLVEELKNRYPKRIVLFDLPSMLNTADTISFAPYVDASLIVVEDDITKESDLKAAADLLSVTNIIGTVLNKKIY
jgi:capsular exopolysaccharide synthesis family protein